MSEINLLQSRIEEGGVNSNPIIKIVAKLLMLLVVVAVGLYITLIISSWLTKKKLVDVNKKIQNVQSSAIANKDRIELVTRQEQLSELETLIKNHKYWSVLLPELARVTLKTAKYSEIDAQDDGKLELSIKLPNYEEIEKFLQIFDLPEYNQQFSNVRIISINRVLTESRVETELNLELTFNPEFIKGKM